MLKLVIDPMDSLKSMQLKATLTKMSSDPFAPPMLQLFLQVRWYLAAYPLHAADRSFMDLLVWQPKT